MLVNLKDMVVWPTNFSCIVVLDDMVLPNTYNLTISILPDNASIDTTMPGLKKIKTFISRFIHNSTLIQSSHPLFLNFSKLSSNTVQLPSAPHDYFVAALLYKKLSAISENYFTIHNITIDSSIGDHVQYQITEACGVHDSILNTSDWWNQDSPVTNLFCNFPGWSDMDIVSTPKFSPVLVKGGKDENRLMQQCNPK